MDKPSSKFLEYVKVLKNCELEFPALKVAILAQSIMECGVGVTKLFQDHNNPRGVHYYDFLKKYAVGVDYVTDTEPDGHGVFCKFFTLDDAAKSYFLWFDYWPHYGDWRVYARKTPTDFLAWIGPHYCPPGYTASWASQHGGLNYHQYIMQNLYPEAEKLLAAAQTTPTNKSYRGELDPTTMNFRIIEEPGSVVYATVKTEQGRNLHLLAGIKAALDLGAYRTLIVNWDKATPPIPPVEPPKPPSKVKTIYVEPGHSKSVQGAQSLGAVNEYEMNELAAKIMIEMIEASGHKTKTLNPDPDNLDTVGNGAKGCDAAFSIHHNAYDKKEHYFRCYFAKTPKASSVSLGNKIAIAVASELKLPEVNNENSGFTVPNIFNGVCSGPSMLLELYFIDAYKDRAVIVDRTTRAAKAVAQEIIKWANS
jgi:N-acetylmuramoyl-L-alanine amidase